jgi:hypothetical protein
VNGALTPGQVLDATEHVARERLLVVRRLCDSYPVRATRSFA